MRLDRWWQSLSAFLAVGANSWLVALVLGSVPLVAAGLLIAARRRGVRWRGRVLAGLAARMVRDFGSFLLLFVSYELLHDLTASRTVHLMDAELAALDRSVFGADLFDLVPRLLGTARPAAEIALATCYVALFPLMQVTGLLLYFSGRARLFRAYFAAILASAFLGYAGYLAVPAVGPIWAFPESVSGQEQSDGAGQGLGGRAGEGLGGRADPLEIERSMRALATGRGHPHDAFPSLHTAWAVLLVGFAWRFDSRLALALLPVMLGLIAATVALRLHYGVDVLAGGALAAAILIASSRRLSAGTETTAARGEPPPFPVATSVTELYRDLCAVAQTPLDQISR